MFTIYFINLVGVVWYIKSSIRKQKRMVDIDKYRMKELVKEEKAKSKSKQNEWKGYDIEEELNNLYFQRELLDQLTFIIEPKNLNELDEKTLKKVITHERQLASINKRINVLESKRRLLE